MDEMKEIERRLREIQRQKEELQNGFSFKMSEKLGMTTKILKGFQTFVNKGGDKIIANFIFK